MLAVTHSVLSTSKQTACSTDAVCEGVLRHNLHEQP